MTLLGGCGSQPFLKPETTNESLIIGYVDWDDAPGKLTGVSIKKIQPVEERPYYNFWIDGGTFYRSSVKPGVYKMDSMRSHRSFPAGSWIFNFPQSGRGEMDVKVVKPGIYYVGSWKYKEIKTGFFEQGKFDLERIAKPTELELLKQVLPEARDPYWVEMINRRIRELSK